MSFRELWCNGKPKNDNNFWNAARFKSFSRVRVYALTNHQLNRKSPWMWRWNKLSILCCFGFVSWPLFRMRIQDSFQLVIYLGCWSLWGKYYENTIQYFKNKHAYQFLSSASRGGMRKRLPLCYIILIKSHFLWEKQVQVLDLFHVYYIIQVGMLWVCFCWQTTVLNLDSTLWLQEANESVPAKDILVVNKPVVCTDMLFKAL